MPRTKAVKGKTNELSRQMLPLIEGTRKKLVQEYKSQINNMMIELSTSLTKIKVSVPKSILNKTIGELAQLPLNWSGCNTTSSIISTTFDTTRLQTAKKRGYLRSSSVGDDEGYLTAESTKSTLGERQSRARSRTKSKSRVSRSLSTRSKMTSLSKFQTPANRNPINSYGVITPKVKPNTPQVLLRRPKLGEVALSLQGSPLLTGAVTSDNVANINIPLEDGRLLSIQPERGLRISQIPELDMETKKQLETLRDNLNKVCALSSIR